MLKHFITFLRFACQFFGFCLSNISYTVESIISGEDGEAKPKPKSVKISNDTYTKYFSDGVKAKEITETIEKALAFYFENMEEN